MKKKKFYIYQEDLIQYQINRDYITISQMVNELNLKFCQDNMKKLRSEVITDFLVENGFLVLNTNKRKIPTKKGEILGIKYKKYIDLNGIEYEINMYNKRAQKFILDNFYEIIQ